MSPAKTHSRGTQTVQQKARLLITRRELEFLTSFGDVDHKRQPLKISNTEVAFCGPHYQKKSKIPTLYLNLNRK